MIPRAAIARAGGLPLIAACASLAGTEVLINEVHHAPHPKTAKVEFVKLLKTGAAAFDLAGWQLAGQDQWLQPAGGTPLTVRNDLELPGISGNRGMRQSKAHPLPKA